MPPLLEYEKSLLAGSGEDLDLRMFKLVDQLSGRTMALRADMTTQVARIDAHLLNRASVTRLCYAGSVLHTRPSGLHATREPLQIGAEIYGHAGLEADAEIQKLAMHSLALAGFSEPRLDLTHPGILRAIMQRCPRAAARQIELYALLRAKDVAGLESACSEFEPATREALLALITLYGGIEVLDAAAEKLPSYPEIRSALSDLKSLSDLAGRASVTIDLADLSGYEYESGAMFSIYVPGLPNAMARGGRYDHVGEAFGRARPATGFSMDLKELARLLPPAERRLAIRAPWATDPILSEKIVELRQAGEIVIQNLPGHENDQEEFDCDRALELENGNWIIKILG